MILDATILGGALKQGCEIHCHHRKVLSQKIKHEKITLFMLWAINRNVLDTAINSY